MTSRFLAILVGLCALALGSVAAQAQQRVALVVGESAYDDRALPTAANDAGLVAQDLRTAGFDIVQGADLDLPGLRKGVRDFLDRVEAAGRGATALVYFAGRAVQFEGENYLVPVGARIERVSDIPIEAFRLSDLMRSLEGLPTEIRIVMLDAARPFPPTQDGQPLARGLALVDPPEGFAVSFSTAPGDVAEDGQGPYGPYATAFIEAVRQPGLSLPDLFGRIRVRVHELTQGRQTPWDAVKSDVPFVFLAPQEGADVAPPPPPAPDFASVGDQEAYAIALERDTIPAYQDFLRAYPDSTFAPRVKRLLAQRREALTWQRTVARDTPEAYWTYLKRYPRGLHAADARRRLARLSAAAEPPPDFGGIEYDIPPPLAGVEVYEWEDRYDYPPPPPPPVYILPPPPREVVILPPPPRQPGYLPVPVPVPVPGWVRPPRPPRDPVVIVPGLDRPRPRPIQPVAPIDPGFQQGRPDPARPSLLQPPPGMPDGADRRRWEQQQRLLRDERRRIEEQRRIQEQGQQQQQRLQDQRRQEELLRRDQQQQQIDRRQEELRRRQLEEEARRARGEEVRRRAIDQQRQRDQERGQDLIRRDRQQQLQQQQQQFQEQQRRMLQQRDSGQEQQHRIQRDLDRRQQQERQREFDRIQQQRMQQQDQMRRQNEDRQRQMEQIQRQQQIQQQQQRAQDQMRRQNEDRQRQMEQIQRQQQIQQQQQRMQDQMRRQQEQQQRQQENMQRMLQQRQQEQQQHNRSNQCGQPGLPPCR